MIPFMGYFAVVGGALALFAKGAGLAATVIFGWGAVVVFVADKFVRAAIIGNAIRMKFFWVLVGGRAGSKTFGLLGLFIGPIILALTGALLRDFLDEATDGLGRPTDRASSGRIQQNARQTGNTGDDVTRNHLSARRPTPTIPPRQQT